MGFSRFIGAAVLILFILLLAHSSPAQLDRLRRSKSLEPVTDNPMVEIPAGEFVMGVEGTQALEDEQPLHRVWLDAFSIDVYEVTTAQYAAFLAAETRATPWQWETVDLIQHGDRPVIGVNWHDAEA
ncbi:MAG TPA: formylglycine-generating enzyme family protein, partial [Nitrospira sp.]|nr:formylglycine-generating enzyme family protein [Nitrospira sp.]